MRRLTQSVSIDTAETSKPPSMLCVMFTVIDFLHLVKDRFHLLRIELLLAVERV